MAVRVWLLGLLLLGGCITSDRWPATPEGPKSEPAVVVLIDGGAEPRRPLRYSFREGSEQQGTVEYEFRQHYTRGSGSSEHVVAWQATIVARTTKVRDDGLAKCEVDIMSGELRETYTGRKQMSYDLKGVRALATINPLGQVEPLQLSQPAAHPWVPGIVELALTWPLPQQPVGPGARWKMQFGSDKEGAWLSTLVDVTPSYIQEVSLPPPIESSVRTAGAPRGLVCPTGCLHRPTLYEGKTKRSLDLSLPMPQELDWQTRQTYASVSPSGEERWLLTAFHRVKSQIVH